MECCKEVYLNTAWILRKKVKPSVLKPKFSEEMENGGFLGYVVFRAPFLWEKWAFCSYGDGGKGIEGRPRKWGSDILTLVSIIV